MASRYDPIWTALKLNGTVKLAIPKGIQKRVIKGVIHCKDHDVVRKLQLAMLHKKEKISYTQEASLVTFKLTQHINLKNLCASEL